MLLKKDSTEQDILQEAKKLFFPNGESPKDKVSDFDIDLWDFLERIVENSITLTNVQEHNNADDDPVMRDIEYDIDAKAMKLSEVTDVRSDNLPKINIRRENRAMVSSAEEDDDHNSAEI